DMHNQAMLMGRFQALNDVLGLWESWKLEDMMNYEPNVEKLSTEAINAFYLVKFPYVASFVKN
ncbi:hypothetical protein Tco_0975203, partial [Tanacetum coccineum]